MRNDKINSKFIEWIQTPAGCNGGNIDGSIWMFGIEWGGDFHQKMPPSLNIYKQHACIEGDCREQFVSANSYNTKLTKLYSAIVGIPTQRYKDVFHATNMFAAKSDTYKGNIFTISSPRDDGKYFVSQLQSLTGCSSKIEYIEAHKEYRFPMIRGWVLKYNPKVIICFGIGRAKDFSKAFSSEEIAMQTISANDKKITWGSLNNGKTLLFICPHVSSANGLNSDERLNAAGHVIAMKAKQHFGAEWHKFYDLKL